MQPCVTDYSDTKESPIEHNTGMPVNRAAKRKSEQ
jgi:hypothetical protein